MRFLFALLKRQGGEFMNPSLQRLGALIRKEFSQLIRDNSTLLMGIVLPLILILIIGYGMSLDVKHVPMAVVLEDNSPTARQMVNFTEGSEYFNPTYVYDVKKASQLLQAHHVDAILVVPTDFSSKLTVGDARLQLILNGGDATTAQVTGAYVSAAVLSKVTQAQAAVTAGNQGYGAVTVDSRLWFNDANTSTWFFVPGILMLVLTITGVFLTAVVMAREWERGTFESLFVTPVRVWEIILAKMLPYFLVAVGGLVLCLLAGRILYDLPMRGSMVLILGTSMLYLLVALCIGLVISAVTKSQFVACQMSIYVSFLPSVMLSGFIFDLHSEPAVIALISQAFPTTYYLQLLKSLLLVGNDWHLIIKNSLILFGYLLVFFGLTFWLTRKKVD